jgi:hypothetical protein
MTIPAINFQMLANAGYPPTRFAAGDVIFSEGDKGNVMYVVRSGEVATEHRGHVMETLGGGGIFGEMALIDGSPRSATVRAKTGMDHRGLLADEELARAMEHQAALLLGRLGLDKPHVCPGHRLTDGFGVSSIGLLSLDVGLHIGRRHQTHGMAKRLELTRPMMRGGASLDPNQARLQLLEERQDVAPLQLTADKHGAFRVNAVDLKN